MRSHWILAVTTCAVCALACGAPAERHTTVRRAQGPPAVAAGGAHDVAPAREASGALAALPPPPGSALLESPGSATPRTRPQPRVAPDLLSASVGTPKLSIVLDARGPDVGSAILGTAMVREPLEPTREPAEALAAEGPSPGSPLVAPVPAAFAE